MWARDGIKKLALISLFALGGCQMWIAGHSDDYAIVVHGTGTANPPARTSTFTLAIDGSDVKCQGTSRANPDGTQTDIVNITCDDGRIGEGKSHAVTADTAEGNGTDNCGNKFYLIVSINQASIEEKLNEYRDTAAKSAGSGRDRCEAQGSRPPHTDPLL